MGDDRKIRGKVEVAGVIGPLWFGAWLFCIGYLGLHMPRVLWAVVLWPYYLGQHFR